MQYDVEQIGSVGNLIVAALETSGHYLQSHLLDVVEAGLWQSLGGLLYAASLLAALLIFSIGGNYKFGTWFLVGPALFYSLTFIRVDSYGAAWQFGQRPNSAEAVLYATKGITDRTKDTPDHTVLSSDTLPEKVGSVSQFFAIYNEIVSGIIQGLISAFTEVHAKSDLTFIGKTDRFATFYELGISDPNISQFIALAAENKCAGYFITLRALQGPQHVQETEQRLRDQLERRARQPAYAAEEFGSIQDYFRGSGLLDIVAKDHPQLVEDASEGKRLTNLTCEQVYHVSISILKVHGEELIHQVLSQSIPEGLTYEEVREQFLKKFKMSTNSSGQITVHDDMDSGAAYSSMINELAARLFLRQISNFSPVVSQVGFVPRDAKHGKDARSVHDDAARAINLMSAREEMQGKGDFLSAALSLPYVQGLVLYFLAASYPFFAFFIIIPGYHQSFIFWMALWLWVKSWDFGFAMVMLIDDILYSLMPHGPVLQDDQVVDPVEAFKAVLEVDPTYSVHTYYNIIAACMFAVPVITGVGVKRGGGEIMHAIEQGFKTFAGKIGGSMAAYQGSLIAQNLNRKANESVVGAARQAMVQSLNDERVFRALGFATAAEASKALLKGDRGMDEGIGETLREALNAGAKAATAANDKVVKQQVAIAQAVIQANVARAANHESISAENMQRASDARRVRFYSHDFLMKYPWQKEIEVDRREKYLELHDIANKGYAPWYLQGRRLITKAIGDTITATWETAQNIDNAVNNRTPTAVENDPTRRHRVGFEASQPDAGQTNRVPEPARDFIVPGRTADERQAQRIIQQSNRSTDEE